MSKHFKNHCGKAPRWGCPYCPQISKVSSNMYAHIRLRHPNSDVFVVDLYKNKDVEPFLAKK